jgi:hypothetical protein
MLAPRASEAEDGLPELVSQMSEHEVHAPQTSLARAVAWATLRPIVPLRVAAYLGANGACTLRG